MSSTQRATSAWSETLKQTNKQTNSTRAVDVASVALLDAAGVVLRIVVLKAVNVLFWLNRFHSQEKTKQ